MQRAIPLRAAVLAAACLVSAGVPGVPGAQDARRQALEPKLEGRALVEALAKGGHVILLRHTATDDFVPDAETFDLMDCSTQRNLSDAGRAQAAAIGRAFEKLGIRVAQVLSSPYCRCVETGTLAFGAVTRSDLLSLSDDLSYEEREQRGAAVRELLGTPPPPGENTVLITHTATLLYSFGLEATPEGIAHAFRPSDWGPAVYVGRMNPDDWPRLAGTDAAGEPDDAPMRPMDED